MNIRTSVLWKPPGVSRFCSRHTCKGRVAYSSQFLDRDNRAHKGKAGGFDSDEWDFPPKPKWMRWRTYHRAEEKFDRYESILDEGTLGLVAKLLGRG